MKMSHVWVRFGWLSLVHAWNLEVFASLLNFTPFSAVLMLLADINNAVHGKGSAMCRPQEPANLVLYVLRVSSAALVGSLEALKLKPKSFA